MYFLTQIGGLRARKECVLQSDDENSSEEMNPNFDQRTREGASSMSTRRKWSHRI